MNYDLEDFIEEAIKLERNAAEIYAIFSQAIPEDADFWSGLSWEERNHASLLKTARDIFMPPDQFPSEMLPAFIQSLIESNNWLETVRQEYIKVRPDRQTAFAVALKIEDSAGEKHFQKVMENPSDSKIVKIFQKLCEDDINHYDRIKKYMSEIGETVETPAERTKRILLVIDDEPVAKLLKTILAIDGEVEVVSNGSDGLRLIKENDYDLIISADDLPIVDGLQFYKEAKTILPDLPKRFLLFTGPPPSDQLSFLKDEKLRYLVKPSSINEIRETALKSLADS